MDLTITLVIAILGCVISVLNFVLARKDKSEKDGKEEQKQFDKHNLIEFRLNSIDKQLEKILNKLDIYEKEVDDRIEKALKNHVLQYHNKD